MKKRTVTLAILAGLVSATGATPFDSVTLRAMKDELARSIDKLELAGFGKPYYLSYEMWDLRRTNVTASFGALADGRTYPSRTLDIDLRVGDYGFDNSNTSDRTYGRSITLPVDDDYDAVRRELWLATDREYKHAVETLERKRAVAKAETRSADQADSFSKEPPAHIVDDQPVAEVALPKLEALAKKLSAVFRNNPDIHDGDVTITAATGKHYFISSEGGASVQPASFVKIVVDCSSQADDGMAIHDSLMVIAASIDQLPAEADLVARVEKLSKEVSALRVAPVTDDYAGPVVFTGIAAGQVIRSLLAEEFAGTPAPKGDRPGMGGIGESSLVGKVGQRLMPVGSSIIDDPTLKVFGKVPLAGAARFDEEGMAAQKVSIVENGIFKRFLMSRTPRKGFEHSNGHASSSPYSPVRAHPMNLIVASTRGVSDAQIRKQAIAAAKQQGMPYVLVVEKLATHRPSMDDFDPSMFSGDATLPKPTVVKRVYSDGHEELVRGASFGAVPIRSLKDLPAIGSTPTVYSYTGSGALSRFAAFSGDSDSGYFVSIAAPPLLFRDLDVKKPIGPHRTAPIVPRPK